MEDSQIVDLFFARSETAIRETDTQYGRYCYRIAYSILANRVDSEESVSDTYLSAWKAIPPCRPAVLFYIFRKADTEYFYRSVTEEIDAVIRSIDEENPPEFSYKQDLIRLEDGTFNEYTDGYTGISKKMVEDGFIKLKLEQKTDGFVNTSTQQVAENNAVQLAAKEIKVDYNMTVMYFDNNTRMWKVEFLASWDFCLTMLYISAFQV